MSEKGSLLAKPSGPAHLDTSLAWRNLGYVTRSCNLPLGVMVMCSRKEPWLGVGETPTIPRSEGTGVSEPT